MFESASNTALAAVFALGGLAVVLCGVRLTRYADTLADRTGLGEAVIGATLLGMATSLSGSMVSITAALDGRASLAFSNGIGGIAAQSAFLAVADLVYRRVNIEHASADLGNILQAALLSLMLGLVAMAYAGPEVTLFGVHPVSLLLPVAYVLGARASARVREYPLWQPVRTRETREDVPAGEPADAPATLVLVGRFLALAALLAVAGWAISKTGAEISARSGLGDSVVGALMTAVVTSLPELITTLAAVRAGAVQLAVAGIIGGNAFDVLFLTASDIAYRDGSLYHAVGRADLFWLAVGASMTAVLTLGLLMREKRGVANIGFESGSVLALYAMAIAAQTL